MLLYHNDYVRNFKDNRKEIEKFLNLKVLKKTSIKNTHQDYQTYLQLFEREYFDSKQPEYKFGLKDILNSPDHPSEFERKFLFPPTEDNTTEDNKKVPFLVHFVFEKIGILKYQFEEIGILKYQGKDESKGEDKSKGEDESKNEYKLTFIKFVGAVNNLAKAVKSFDIEKYRNALNSEQKMEELKNLKDKTAVYFQDAEESLKELRKIFKDQDVQEVLQECLRADFIDYTLNGEIKKLNSKNKELEEELKSKKSEKTSVDFSNQYEEIREKFEVETRIFLHFEEFPKQEQNKENKDKVEIQNSNNKTEGNKLFLKLKKILEKIRFKDTENFTKSEIINSMIFLVFILGFYFFSFYRLSLFLIFLGGASVATRLFTKKTPQLFCNLSLKIFLLRIVTYIIPIFLFTFHFCEVFDPGGKSGCKACSWLVIDSVKDDQRAEANHSNYLNISAKEGEIKIDQNRNFISKNSPNNSYIYFHLALITGLLLAFQQLRSAITEMNIKKSLIEVYRHRQLVARNYHKMRDVVDGADKSEVVKSATKALFENEPAIYQNGSNPMPPKAFDINLWPKN